MAKNEKSFQHVVWHLVGDAIRPKDAPWGFVIQNPVQRVLMPGQVASIDTGVAASVPLVCWVRGDRADCMTVPQLVTPGTTLVVTVENKSKHMPLAIDDRVAMANVHPLSWGGTSEVD